MADGAMINFKEDLRAHRIGTVGRMKAVLRVLEAPKDVQDAQGIDAEALDLLLEELQDLLSATDMSVVFHSLGGLMTVLTYLKCDKPDHRGRAADVVATLVWDNPYSQRLVMEVNGFEALFRVFISDESRHIRAHALGAIFSLIRSNRPALVKFRLACGYEALRHVLISGHANFQRKALDLVYLILQDDSRESNLMYELGYTPIMIRLASHEDAQVRESALWGLLKLANLMKDRFIKDDIDDALKHLLHNRIQHISSLRLSELRKAREERVLVDSLWRACFNEPSCLGDEGLLVVPGEDAIILPRFERQPFGSPIRSFDIKRALPYKSQSIDLNAYVISDDSDTNDSTVSK